MFPLFSLPKVLSTGIWNISGGLSGGAERFIICLEALRSLRSMRECRLLRGRRSNIASSTWLFGIRTRQATFTALLGITPPARAPPQPSSCWSRKASLDGPLSILYDILCSTPSPRASDGRPENI